MGSALLFERGADRAGFPQARLVLLERQFTRTVSVSNEIDAALPFHGLPLGCVHEVQSRGLASGITFSGLLAARIRDSSGQILYVAPGAGFHPLGLLPYGILPGRWIHVTARNSFDLAWTVLEALRCPQVSAVLAVAKAADLTLCRRWQLAAEGSGATGFLLTDSAAKSAIASVITRWQIASIPAPAGATFTEPCWSIDLTYCRGGRPAQWTVAWREGRLTLDQPSKPLQREDRIAAARLAV